MVLFGSERCCSRAPEALRARQNSSPATQLTSAPAKLAGLSRDRDAGTERCYLPISRVIDRD
jgi:hypothetical protein